MKGGVVMCVKRCELPWLPERDDDGQRIPDHLQGPRVAADPRSEECPQSGDEDGKEVRDQ